MRDYQFYTPKSFDDLFSASKANSDKQVWYLAGGTDLVPRINMERDEIPYDELPPVLIVSLAKLGLDQVKEKDGEITIGAMARLSCLEANPAIKQAPTICKN